VRILFIVACLLVALSDQAFAQHTIQVTPDQKRNLISKDINGQRWAITYNLDDNTVVGNVFFPGGGDPQFVWCQQTGVQGDQFTFSCSGAPACTVAPCSPNQWTFISDVTLPQSFFYPPGGVPVPTPTPMPNPTPSDAPAGMNLCDVCTVNGDGENVVHGGNDSTEHACYDDCTAARTDCSSGDNTCQKVCEDQCNGCGLGLGCYKCNDHCIGGYTERRCSYPEAPGNACSDGQFGGDGFNFN
jgi:hypothetical protein